MVSKRRLTNRKARIEKKFSTESMHLLTALMPRQYPRKAFALDEGYLFHEDISYAEWQVCTVDNWGEADGCDAFYLLHSALITETTDWEGIGNLHDELGWDAEGLDESPFYSPWRIGNVTRSEIIRHCRQLVKAGVTWEQQC